MAIRVSSMLDMSTSLLHAVAAPITAANTASVCTALSCRLSEVGACTRAMFLPSG